MDRMERIKYSLPVHLNPNPHYVVIPMTVRSVAKHLNVSHERWYFLNECYPVT